SAQTFLNRRQKTRSDVRVGDGYAARRRQFFLDLVAGTREQAGADHNRIWLPGGVNLNRNHGVTLLAFDPRKSKTRASRSLSELTKLATFLCNYPMPDEPPPPPPVSDSPKSTGLPSNIAAALACIPLIGGIVFYILEKHDSFVRFYSMQSIILGGAWLLFYSGASGICLISRSRPVIAGVLDFFCGIIVGVINIAFVV